jgi:hypothetical protein
MFGKEPEHWRSAICRCFAVSREPISSCSTIGVPRGKNAEVGPEEQGRHMDGKTHRSDRNDLLTSPDLVPSLIGILCQFGRCEMMLSTEIAEMWPYVWSSDSSRSRCFVCMDGRSSHQRDV